MKQTLTTLFALTFGASLLVLPASRGDAQTDLSAKIAAAKTAVDHEAIAAELEQEAKDFEAKAALHADMAKHYGIHYGRPTLKKHCEKLSADLKQAAQQATEMAKLHHELAQKAGE